MSEPPSTRSIGGILYTQMDEVAASDWVVVVVVVVVGCRLVVIWLLVFTPK